ncbi:MAG: hypothetical protein ACI9X0_002326 [Kiritimatiellia bacterium]|jgi:hypothetical protein
MLNRRVRGRSKDGLLLVGCIVGIIEKQPSRSLTIYVFRFQLWTGLSRSGFFYDSSMPSLNILRLISPPGGTFLG